MTKSQDKLFKEGLKEQNLSKLKKVAKGDVHSHCGLGLRFSTFNKWAGGSVTKPPKAMDGIKGLDKYIFNETIGYIKTGKDVEFLIEEAVKEAISDGVTVLEPSIDCHDITYFNNENDFLDAIMAIKNKYKDKIDFRPEVGMPKLISPGALEDLLIPCIDSGIFKSIDLYGNETRDDDYERLKKYYRYARKKGLKLKVHAGEFQGPENIKKAIEILDVDEIQHGISSVNDQYAMDLIKERNIRLNICPSSNRILGSVKDMKKHPSRKLFDQGIKITINTDDLLIFDSGVSEEYLYLYKLGLFNEDELNEIRKMSLI
ncbi:hypothetical protein [Dethiothermospora halolimnae]|uniref:hypothetical protein n=1 Tax=Dethiothermospora halolimnae TaxID=3114390 RepID=UPI003CCBCF9D